MLSTPVCGVDRRKATVAPRLAPCFLSEADTGITPHEQSGRGIPNKAALRTGLNPFPPKCRSTASADRKADSIPAMAKPNRRYGPMLMSVLHNSEPNTLILVLTAFTVLH